MIPVSVVVREELLEGWVGRDGEELVRRCLYLVQEYDIEFVLHKVLLKNGAFHQLLQPINAPTA